MTLCERTLCLFKPGVKLPGVVCVFHWTGQMPCTGRLVCYTCGKEKR